jgi:hypothetical protein
MNAINEILEKNDSIKQLCDNAWITLLNMDENGKIKHRYTSDFNWEEVSPEESKQENKQLVTI